jgi:hypothetical protein
VQSEHTLAAGEEGRTSSPKEVAGFEGEKNKNNVQQHKTIR